MANGWNNNDFNVAGTSTAATNVTNLTYCTHQQTALTTTPQDIDFTLPIDMGNYLISIGGETGGSSWSVCEYTFLATTWGGYAKSTKAPKITQLSAHYVDNAATLRLTATTIVGTNTIRFNVTGKIAGGGNKIDIYCQCIGKYVIT